MKNKLINIVTASLLITSAAGAADLSEQDKQFLAKYEQIRAALAADDLAKTKTAAADLGSEGSGIAKADKIAAARSEFAKLSDRAITLAKEQSGYYVMHCPMLKKDWVQTSDKVANPYAGKEMLTCGEVKK